MNPRYSFLALNALKFFRKIIGLKDEFYNRYIVKFDLMSYVVDAFVKNGQKHNMLNSAVLELMEFIKIEDLKTLIKYVCEKHIQSLLDVEQCATFKALQTKHEQIVERERAQKAKDSTTKGPGAGFDSSNRFRRDPRDLDENEENYFRDDDEPTPPATPTPEINKALYNSPLVVQNRVLDTKPPPNKVITSSPTITGSTPDKVVNSLVNSSPLVSSSPLVDYADDSDDGDDDDDQPLKRQKVSSTVT